MSPWTLYPRRVNYLRLNQHGTFPLIINTSPQNQPKWARHTNWYSIWLDMLIKNQVKVYGQSRSPFTTVWCKTKGQCHVIFPRSNHYSAGVTTNVIKHMIAMIVGWGPPARPLMTTDLLHRRDGAPGWNVAVDSLPQFLYTFWATFCYMSPVYHQVLPFKACYSFRGIVLRKVIC